VRLDSDIVPRRPLESTFLHHPHLGSMDAGYRLRTPPLNLFEHQVKSAPAFPNRYSCPRYAEILTPLLRRLSSPSCKLKRRLPTNDLCQRGNGSAHRNKRNKYRYNPVLVRACIFLRIPKRVHPLKVRYGDIRVGTSPSYSVATYKVGSPSDIPTHLDIS